MQQANFLDVTLSLASGKHWPYRKPNNQPLYIHKESNHPSTITKELPKMIQRRISDLSSDKLEFDRAKQDYETALANSGFKEKLNFEQSPATKRKRTRNIIWFNPPYNAAVSTNIGHQFLSLVNKHFPSHHKFSKIFNRNTIKLSYSCAPNIKSIISSHNKKLLATPSIQEPPKNCNCRDNSTCPLNGECQQKAIIYKATVHAGDAIKEYIGGTESTFKQRLASHKKFQEQHAAQCNKAFSTCLGK